MSPVSLRKHLAAALLLHELAKACETFAQPCLKLVGPKCSVLRKEFACAQFLVVSIQDELSRLAEGSTEQDAHGLLYRS